MRSALQERPVASHRAPRDRAGTPLGVARLTVLAAALAVGSVLPQPARGILLLPICLMVPAALWAYELRARLGVDRQVAYPLGMLVSLAGWSLIELVLLLAGAGSGYEAASATMILLCAFPLLHEGITGLSRPRLTRPRVDADLVRALVLTAMTTVGALLIWQSMALAKHGAGTQKVYAVFWLGTFAIYAPAFALALRRSRWSSNVLLCLLGLGSYAHVFLRSPLHALMYDELGHWGETQELLASGRLFQPDAVVGVGPKYPGLETLVAPVARISGVESIAVGQICVALFHILALFGIAALARLVLRGHDPRLPLIAACVYAVNPSFLEIDSLFAYESFAIPLLIWATVCALQWSSTAESSRAAWGWCLLALSAASVVNHHLSTFFLAALLVVLGLAAPLDGMRLRGPRASRPAATHRAGSLILAGGALALAGTVWSILVSAHLTHYLGIFPQAAADAVTRLVHGQSLGSAAGATTYSGQQTGTRELFGGSLLPSYERDAALLTQPLLLAWFALGTLRLHQRRTPLRWAFIVVGACYFISLPATLVSGASSGAHRSWAFSYVALAVVLAAAFTSTTRLRVERTHLVSWLTVVPVLTLSVVLVGNYSAAVNAYQRVPGDYFLSVDGRSVTPDIIRSAQWFERRYGRGVEVLTTLRVRSVFGAYADTQGVNYPGWQIFFPAGNPLAADVARLLASNIQFLVVDNRISTRQPQSSYFGIAGEPPAPGVKLAPTAVTKFDHVRWLRLVHRDVNIAIYQVIRP